MKPMHTFALLAILSAVGCDNSSSSAPAAPTVKSEPQYRVPAIPKLDYAVKVKTSATTPKTYAAVWSITVPTSGWKLATDSVLVEESMGVTSARVWATLEQPHPSEPVTQTPETLTGEHDAGEQQVDKVELSIRVMPRGFKLLAPPLYEVVKHE